MRLVVLLVASFAASLLFAPPAATEANEPRLFLLHDVPDDGYTYVGNPVQFGYILLDAERQTEVHQDGLIRVVQNDVVLYETNEVSSHDYNGLNTFTVAFPTTGPYTVYSRVPGAGSVVFEAAFEGFVYPNFETTQAAIELNMPSSATVGTPTDFEIRLLDQAGAIIPHSDAMFEVRRPDDQWLVFRTHLHTHDEPMTLQYAFTKAGMYLVRATGYMAYPEPDVPHFVPVSITQAIEVSEGNPGGAAAAPALPKGTGPCGFRLPTTVDPQPSNTPFSRSVLSVLAYNASADAMEPHVNFAASLTDQNGRPFFYSESLHEYDGNLEVTIGELPPGLYTLRANAFKGCFVETKQDLIVAETVPGPGGGRPIITSAGVAILTADGLDDLRSGTPHHIKFTANNVAGLVGENAATAAQHSEIDFQIVKQAWGPPILQNKLHTHMSGTFEVDINFPEAGDYKLILDPVFVHGEPTARYYFGELDGPLVVPVSVAPGESFPVIAPPPLVPDDPGLPPNDNFLPGAGPALALFALVGFAAFLRRRR